MESNLGRFDMQNVEEIASDVAKDKDGVHRQSRSRIQGKDCVEFLNNCGVATSGKNAMAKLLIARASVVASIILLSLASENVSNIFNKRITRNSIPESLKDNLESKESLGEIEALIATARSYPKAKTNDKGFIFVDGIIGSEMIPAAATEAAVKADVAAVTAWKEQPKDIPRAPLSPTSARPSDSNQLKVSIPQLKTYLSHKGYKIGGTRVMLEARVREPSDRDLKRPLESKPQKVKKIKRNDGETYLEMHGFASNGTANDVHERALLVAQVNHLEKEDDPHLNPGVSAALEASKSDVPELSNLRPRYDELSECQQRKPTPKTPSTPMTTPTSADQFGTQAESHQPFKAPCPRSSTQTQTEKRRLDNFLHTGAKLLSDEKTRIFIGIQQENPDGTKRVTIMADNLETAIDDIGLLTRSAAATYNPRKYPNMTLPQSVSSCVIVRPSKLIEDRTSKSTWDFHNVPISDGITNLFQNPEQTRT